MPVVDSLAEEYSDRVDFVAPAWKSSEQATRRRAEELFQSGEILWGLDAEEEIFASYGIPYQPVTVLIASDGTVLEAWAGVRPEKEIRASIEELLEVSA